MMSIFERYLQLTLSWNQLSQPQGPISPALVKTSFENDAEDDDLDLVRMMTMILIMVITNIPCVMRVVIIEIILILMTIIMCLYIYYDDDDDGVYIDNQCHNMTK